MGCDGQAAPEVADAFVGRGLQPDVADREVSGFREGSFHVCDAGEDLRLLGDDSNVDVAQREAALREFTADARERSSESMFL